MRKVAIFTGNRAEYGLQLPVIRAVDNHPELVYSLIVSGAHLDPRFGCTLDEIKRDGVRIDAEVSIDISIESPYATSQAIGSAIIGLSNALAQISPDMLVVYADRFEGFSAVVAASQMNIPTVHIEGGDLTEGGAHDDSVRHAMTKLSHLHFTTNQQSTNRILAMGEEPWRVHTVGLPAGDLIAQRCYATATEVCEKLLLDLDRPVLLFTQHSVSTEYEQSTSQIRPSLEAINTLADLGVQCILTYPNNDAGGLQIVRELENLRSRQHANIQLHRSLGRHLYHGVLALALNHNHRITCVGNSSSGLKETPFFMCPTVNIGTRQNGRLCGGNIINCDYSYTAILSAVNKALYNEEFRALCRTSSNPYGIGNTATKIADILAHMELDERLIRKRMTIQGVVSDGWYQ